MKIKIGVQSMWMAVAVLTICGCGSSIEKQMEDQDARLKGDRDRVVEKYRAKYEKNKNSPAALFLYARLLQDVTEQDKLADKLNAEHPSFSWGWYLKGVASEGRGDIKAALAAFDKAGASAPKSKVIDERLRVAKRDNLIFEDLANVDSDGAFRKMTQASVRNALADVRRSVDNCKILFEELKQEPVAREGLKIKGLYTESEPFPMMGEKGTVWIGAAILNNSPAKITVSQREPSDVVCWNREGKLVRGREKYFMTRLKGHGFLTDTITIEPGEYACPHAALEWEPDRYLRCRLRDVLEKKTVHLYIRPRATTASK